MRRSTKKKTSVYFLFEQQVFYLRKKQLMKKPTLIHLIGSLLWMWVIIINYTVKHLRIRALKSSKNEFEAKNYYITEVNVKVQFSLSTAYIDHVEQKWPVLSKTKIWRHKKLARKKVTWKFALNLPHLTIKMFSHGSDESHLCKSHEVSTYFLCYAFSCIYITLPGTFLWFRFLRLITSFWLVNLYFFYNMLLRL